MTLVGSVRQPDLGVRRRRGLLPYWIWLVGLVANAQSPAELRRAVERTLPLIQKSESTFVEKRACFSCHHNSWGILALHAADRLAFSIDKTALKSVEDKTFRPVSGPNALDD